MKGAGEDAVLARLRRDLPSAERGAQVRLVLHPKRSDPRGRSPDFIVNAEVTIPLFDRLLRIRVPILVEVEACAGVEEAMQDLERYLERAPGEAGEGRPPVELPFAVITARGEGRRFWVERPLSVRFAVSELPLAECGEPPASGGSRL